MTVQRLRSLAENVTGSFKMKLLIFSTFDSKAKVFSQPYYMSGKGAAMRAFQDAVNEGTKESNVMKRHPEDFSMFHLGEYNDETASFTMEKVPVHVVNAFELVDKLPLVKLSEDQSVRMPGMVKDQLR